MDNKNTISDNLRSDVVRNLIENRNTLAQKGALYVGTGNSQEFDGTSCAETVAITPPSQVDCVLVSDNSPSAEGGLKWKTIKQAVQDARNNGQSIAVDDANNAVSSQNVSTTINGVALSEIFESDKKTAKQATLAQNIVDGAVTGSSLNKPQQLVSHSIYIKASDYSMEVAIPCVNNSSSYGNNFLNFCNDYKSGSVAYAENLTAGGHLNRETDGGLFVNITQAMKMEKISAGQVFKYKIDFAGVRYNSEKNRMEGSTLSLYIRNGDDGTKAYKYIEPTSGEPVYTIRDLAYSITGIENI